MKLSWLVIIALLCCALALAQETSPGEKPPAGQDSSHHAGEKEDQDSSSDIMCTLQALECPDGTFATQNKQCQYICGKAPVGGLSYEAVATVLEDFLKYYSPRVVGFRISHLNLYKVAIQSPPESTSDYCIEALIPQPNHVGLPDVYNGVRVMYVQNAPSGCSPMLCPDGSVAGCNEVCPPEVHESGVSTMFTPMTIILGVFLLSACCCCLRKRRRCRAKCQMSAPLAPQATLTANPEDLYPAEQYLLQQEQAFEPEIPMHAVPMYPPMPMIPPQMMVMPNGSYPIMMQAPNGMWYPVAPHPEDV